MFKCTVCQKLYNTKVTYCECGNDDFIFIQEPEFSEKSSSHPPADILSIAIFVLCLILSGCVLFLFNPVKSHHKPAPKTQTESVQTNIPEIDKIWNDTPSYTTSSTAGSSMEVYKKSLQNLLNTNITPKQFSGQGRCDIEFTVANNGKLVNRKMFKKDGSSEFNQIVLNMLQNTNEHRIPPSDYLGEVIRGEVIVQDGLIKLYIK